MTRIIISWVADYLWNSGVLKTTTASAVGSAAVVVGLGQYQVQEIEHRFISERTAVEQYVNEKHVEAMTSIQYINKRQDDILLELKSVNNKLWDLNKYDKE